MQLSQETKETVNTIDRVVFRGETCDNEFYQFLIDDHYIHRCEFCRRLSLETGADYDAFIVAYERIWIQIYIECRHIDNLIDELMSWVVSYRETNNTTPFQDYIAHITEWTDIDGGDLPHILTELYLHIRRDSVSSKRSFIRQCERIYNLNLRGRRLNAFQKAKELCDDHEVDLNVYKCDDVPQSVKDYFYYRLSNIFLIKRIKKRKQRWTRFPDYRPNVMARYFELNRTYEKLSGRIPGKIGLLSLATRNKLSNCNCSVEILAEVTK
jgi:hypothetical protein